VEQPGGQNSIEDLKEFLVRTGLEYTSMDFDLVFSNVKFDWITEQGKDYHKSLDEFLRTTIYNARARRIGLEKKGNSDLGQPGLEIQLSGDEVPDAFFLEVYHWKNKSSEPPQPLTSRLVLLTGNDSLNGEKLVQYLTRLQDEGKATFEESIEGDSKTTRFEMPLGGHLDFKASGYVKIVKTEKGYGMKEIALDIKIPYQEIGSWLTPKV